MKYIVTVSSQGWFPPANDPQHITEGSSAEDAAYSCAVTHGIRTGALLVVVEADKSVLDQREDSFIVQDDGTVVPARRL